MNVICMYNKVCQKKKEIIFILPKKSSSYIKCHELFFIEMYPLNNIHRIDINLCYIFENDYLVVF